MISVLLLPAATAVALAFVAAPVQRRVRPDLAVPLLAAMAAVSATAVVGALLLVVLGAGTAWPLLAPALGWCPVLMGDPHIATLPGVAAGLALTLVAGRLLRRAQRMRVSRDLLDGPSHEVLDVAMPMAFAVPGRPGRVVVSKGLLDELDPEERQAVWAHEVAHLDQRHSRYVRIAELSAAVPLLAPVAAQVRYATERAADEAAAAAVGSRRVVARAVLRAALTTKGSWLPSAALAMGGVAVEDRVRAMLGEAPAANRLAPVWLLAVVTLLIAIVGTSTLQLHHLAALGAHVCGIG